MVHGTEYGIAIATIRRRMLTLAADWLADQTDNGFDGYVEYLLEDLPMWDAEIFDLMLDEGHALAQELSKRGGDQQSRSPLDPGV